MSKFTVFILLFIANLLFFVEFATTQTSRIKFDNISLTHGLSQSTVVTILQDKQGFMWFGTLDGLNKYDGYQVTAYRNRAMYTHSIPDNSINIIFEDISGTIWIGTRSGGLCRYDKIKDNFAIITHDPQNPNSISSNTITSICEDHKGTMWIGTDKGLNKFTREQIEKHINTGKQSFVHFQKNPSKKHSLSCNIVNQILKDKTGNLWIATEDGLNKFNLEDEIFTVYNNIAYTPERLSNSEKIGNEIRALYIDSDGTLWIGTDYGLTKRDRASRSFTTYIHNPMDPQSLSNDKITTLIEDNSGILWVGTEKGGLNRFNRKEETFVSFRHDPYDPYSLSTDHVLTLFKDKTGVLWIGTSLGGVCKWNRTVEGIDIFRHNPYDSESLSASQVRTIYQDKSGNFWIGTVDGGLNRWDVETNTFSHYMYNPLNKNSLSHNHVRSILEDTKGNFWIGTDGGGISKLNINSETFTRYEHDDDRPGSIPNDRVWKIYEDSQGVIWIGTYGGGLAVFNTENGTFEVFDNDSNNPETLSNNYVTSILEDHYGVLWIGTYGGGLNKWNKKEQTFTCYQHDESNPKSIGNNRVYSIFEDTEGILWIGTKGSLNSFDRVTESFKQYDEEDGLPNNVIMGILEDNNNNLWISTNKGLCRFSKTDEQTRNYDARDGLQSNEFLVGSYYKAKDGEMLFGGINGFNTFFPDEIKDNPFVPEIIITHFQVFNEDMELDSSITEKKRIELDYYENFLSFEFVALNYIFPEKNQYKYKMEGVDDDWNDVKDRRFATYTNLPPRKYVFRVIGSNNDGVWNEEGAALQIIIKPAFWQTLWFKISIGICLLFLAFLYYKWRIRRIEAQKKYLEKIVRLRTAEIVSQKEEIEAQRDAIEEQRDEIEEQRDKIIRAHDVLKQHKEQIEIQAKEIKDSIVYAKRIQNATLPTIITTDRIVSDYFILFKPKDIVSGDFYWVGSRDDKLIIIAADCTGHGVPGAFMSMLGISFLNKIVNEKKISQPNEILDRLRENVIKSLHQTGAENEARDGMDISVCTIDKTKMKLYFSGANNPLYMVRDMEATVYKGDKMPIAIYDTMDSFSFHEIDIQKGDCVYIFSDGFADQFGGPKGKKFKYKPFRDVLVANSPKSMQKQKEILDTVIEDWKACPNPLGGTYEQVDDIVVIGFRI